LSPNSQIFKKRLFLSSFLSGSRSGRFSYGYSSFKGKRSSMEDFFETTISEVDGQMVAFFGVFDGKPVLYSLKLDFFIFTPFPLFI